MRSLHPGIRRGEAGCADGRAKRLSCGQVHGTRAWEAHWPGAEAGMGRRGPRILDLRSGVPWLLREG